MMEINLRVRSNIIISSKSFEQTRNTLTLLPSRGEVCRLSLIKIVNGKRRQFVSSVSTVSPKRKAAILW